MKRLACPACGSNDIATFLYGMPMYTPALDRELEQGTVILGGCDINPDAPRWCCNSCNHLWGETLFSLSLKEAEKKEREKMKAAEERGVLEVATNSNNNVVTCPVCNTKFKYTSKRSFKSGRHITCKTRLKIVKRDE